MAFRNTLLLCVGIVALGGIAGLSVKPHSFGYLPPNDTGSGFYGGQPQPTAAPPPDASPPPSAPVVSDSQTLSLAQIDQPDRLLPRMPVETTSGQRIGEVRSVLVDGNGRAREIVLDRGDHLQAADVVFVPARSVLIAQVSTQQQPNGYGPPNGQSGYGPPNQQNGYGPPNPQNGYGSPNQPNNYGPPNAPGYGPGYPPNGYPPNSSPPPNGQGGYPQGSDYGPPPNGSDQQRRR